MEADASEGEGQYSDDWPEQADLREGEALVEVGRHGADAEGGHKALEAIWVGNENRMLVAYL